MRLLNGGLSAARHLRIAQVRVTVTSSNDWSSQQVHHTGRPQRFLENYLADPTQDTEDLRVAVTPDGRLVSTVSFLCLALRCIFF